MEQNINQQTEYVKPPESAPVIKAPLVHHFNWPDNMSHYVKGFALALIFFTAISVYVGFRRGYYDLYIINKALAGSGTLMLGLVFLIGPLSRMFNAFDKYVVYRKEFGVIGMLLILGHSISSYFFLQNKFPHEQFYGSQLWPFIFGLLGVILLVTMFMISREFIRNKLGTKRWWQMQYWGLRAIFILTALHVFVMKYNGWVLWYKNGGSKDLVHPEWPGAGLIVGWFIFFVLLVRVAEAMNAKLGKIVWYFSVVAFPLVIALTFIFAVR
jgi:DMSO/TMAO reductase YedYZ heme-binding membrane subunit